MNSAVKVRKPDLLVEGPHAIAEVRSTGEPLGRLCWITVAGGGETTLIHIDDLADLIDALTAVQKEVNR